MAGRARVPHAEMTGIFGAMAKTFSRKKLGQVPEPLAVMWHNRPVLRPSSRLPASARRGKRATIS